MSIDLSQIEPIRGVRRNRAPRAIRPSLRTELKYRADLYLLVGWCQAIGVSMLNDLRPHWAAHGMGGDAAPKTPGDPFELIARSAIYAHVLTDVGNKRSVVRRVLKDVDARLSSMIDLSLGIDITPYLAKETGGEIYEAMTKAATQNVALIKSIPTQYLDRVRAAIADAFANGKRFETLAVRIKDIGKITKRRAAFIARDQMSKMNASFNRVRQTFVGIQEYTWSGVKDSRERKSHLVMEGSTQRWDSPPLVDGENVAPGEAPECRCVAIPKLGFVAAAQEERQAA